MSTERAPWHEARTIIERHIGPVQSARPVAQGHNSAIAVVINDEFFVKGVRRGEVGKFSPTQTLERRLNSHLGQVTAPLLWSAEEDDWSLLGFRYLVGARAADYSPGSRDLPLVVELLAEAGEIQCPDVPMKAAENRWKAYSDDPEHLVGKTLLHTDWNPGNVLISGGKAYAVDWAWGTKGAAWIDPASWVVLLIAAGHTAREAEQWASRAPNWKLATSTDLDKWAKAQDRLWHNVLHPWTPKWVFQAAHAAEVWRRYRT